jgi:tetratricopeptide (TPR) repeat protein
MPDDATGPQSAPLTPAAALLRQGVAAHRDGDLPQAAQAFEQVLAQNPGNPDALLLLGTVRIDQGDTGAAAALIGQALRLRPDFPPALRAQASLWRDQGRIAEAHALLRRALRRLPDDPAIRTELALTLYQAGRPEEAIPLYQSLIGRNPRDVPLLVNLGRALRAAGDFAGAEAAYRRALAGAPEEPEVHNNLGNVLLAQGDAPAAIAAYRSAIARRPDYANAHYNLGMALLAAGELAEGWRECAWRLVSAPATAGMARAVPVWTGEPMPHQTLLLRAEQGQGDTIQFVRYAPLAAQRSGAHVVLEVQRSLVPLLTGLPGVAAVVAQGDPLPECDRVCPLLTLPEVFGTVTATIPAGEPYLHPPADRVAGWQVRLAGVPGLKVGLVWAGEPNLGNQTLLDRRRSLPLAALAPLAAVPDTVFVSLQKGAAAAQARQPPAGMVLLDWTADLHDFADTAALIGALDLVISVDTAVAHLAGALGRPVWLLNRSDSDWRWGFAGETTPWYPSMRLFRQPRPGDWTDPVQRVAAALADRPALEPVRPAGTPPEIGLVLRDALADQQAGRTETALRRYQDVLRADPDQPDALYLSGMVHLAAGRMEPGIELVQHALRQRPDFPAARFNLGMAFHALDREAEAVEQFRTAIALEPGMAEAHAALGGSLHRLAQMPEALAALRRALELRPDDAATLLNHGVVTQALGNIEAAIDSYRRAIALNPGSVDAHNNLGTALAATLDLQGAIASYRQALALDPGHAQTHTNLGIALLQVGQYREGWLEWAWRFQTSQGRREVRGFHQPEWDGGPLPDGTLLLHAEQGLGDTIQFARYVPLAAARAGGRVILEVQGELVRLLHGLPGVAAVLPRGAALPAFDRHCALASLPGLFDTTPESVPADIPYLKVSRGAAMTWRERLRGLRGIRVGLVWAGNAGLGSKTHNPVDSQRSLSLDALAPLGRVPGVSLISLQKGPSSARAIPPPPGMVLHDWTDELHDVAETGALIACLHLVITVDTAMAHLAGALGRPVWLLNRHHPDWRWLLGREDSPWYPTLRQFRQATPGDWGPVIEAVAACLARMAAGPPENEPFEHGNARFRQGDYPAAAAAFRQVLAINPRHAGARGNLSVALLTQLRPDEAERQARDALREAPDSQPLRLRLGIALHGLGRFDEAVAVLREAVALKPEDADAHSALGNALSAAGDLAGSIAAHRRALALRPDNDLLHANLGYTLLAAGEWAEGWREHEYRADRPRLSAPRWQGERLAAGPLLLRHEQGYGDTIQFARFAPLAAGRAGVPTVLTAPSALCGLVAGLPDVTVLPADDKLPAAEREYPLLSLPLLFGTEAATIPAAVPYLHPDPAAVAHWRQRLPAGRRRVGLAWAGNPRLGRTSLYATDRRRSLPEGALAALAGLPEVAFVSLQVGPAPAAGLAMTDWTAELRDFAATAALVAALDLVISVDTAVAHLAGALGRPVWLLNRFDADWRWLAGRTDSPWYPTLRQFRQPHPGDWPAVLAQVRAALAAA